MLSSSLDTLLKVSKTTYPIKLFAYDCVTLYIYCPKFILKPLEYGVGQVIHFGAFGIFYILVRIPLVLINLAQCSLFINICNRWRVD